MGRSNKMRVTNGCGIGGVLLLFGCATSGNYRPEITPQGVQKRTGFSLPREVSAIEKVGLPPGIDIARPLTEDHVAAVALWNNAQFQAELTQLGLAQAEIVDSGLWRNPRVDVLIPIGAKPFEMMLNLPFEALWESPRREAAAKVSYERLAESLVHNALITVRDARIAHANVIQAEKREAISKTTFEIQDKMASVTEVRRKDGEVRELDSITAKAAAVTAEENLIQAKRDVNLAKNRLRQILGLEFKDVVISVAASDSAQSSPPDMTTLLDKALAARPDLRAAELAVAAAAKRADWEGVRFGQLSALLSAKGVGTNGVLAGPGLSAEIPIFNQNQGQRARADAEVEMAARQYLAVKQRVAFEVREARETLLRAREAMSGVTGKILPLRQKAVHVAERDLKRGDAALWIALEQRRSLVEAELRGADCEADVARAWAELERATATKVRAP